MSAIPQFFPGLPDFPALAALRERRQWVAWKYFYKDGPDKKPTKPPVNPHSGLGASHSNPVTWGSYDEALIRAWRDHLPGIGYVLDDRDGLTGADLDECRDLHTGQLAQWAREIVDLKESYTEVSPSGTGVRIIWRGKIDKTIKCDPAHVEVYRSRRYLTITGQHIQGTPLDILPAPKTAAALEARARRFGQPEPAPAPKLNGHAPASDFRAINDRALADLGAWVTHIFPRAKFQPATRAYRVRSRDLGRSLQEDISLAPNGIVDFGIADQGDPKQGKRSPIDIVIEHGGMLGPLDAAQWLAGRLGMADPFAADPIAGESQRALAALVNLAEPEVRKPALDTSDLSDLRFHQSPYLPESMPGILGELTAHILETSLYPVPDFACLSSIILASALYGRRWSEPIMGGGLNIYAIATAPTGWGKSDPLLEPRNVAYRADMMHLMGPGEFKSDSAIEKILRKGPVRACYMDEIGIVFQANSSRNASAWEKRVRKALLEVYSASRGMWTGAQAAGDKDERDKGAEPMHRPLLSIYGTSTPEELYKGLTEDNIRDGLFGRLIFAAPDAKPVKQRPGEGRYDALVSAIDAIRSYCPPSIPEKQRALYQANLRSSMAMPFQVRVEIAGDARASLDVIDEWQRDLTERDSDLAKIANRAAENVGKLATLRALSRDHAQATLILEDVQWAWSIIERSLSVIAKDIEEHMVGSEFEGLVKAIKHHLREAGKEGLKLADLIRRRGIARAHMRDVNVVLRTLQETGEIAVDKTSNRGHRVRLF